MLILSMGLCLYQGGTFINFEKSPGGTNILGGTFIRESRVVSDYKRWKSNWVCESSYDNLGANIGRDFLEKGGFVYDIL